MRMPILGAILLVQSPLPAAHLAADSSYEAQLNTPKFESLQTAISPTGGVVAVQIQVQYDAKGTALSTGSVDGTAVTSKATIKTTSKGTSYKFTLRSATVLPTVVSISGTVGINTAVCSYSGPQGPHQRRGEPRHRCRLAARSRHDPVVAAD